MIPAHGVCFLKFDGIKIDRIHSLQKMEETDSLINDSFEKSKCRESLKPQQANQKTAFKREIGWTYGKKRCVKNTDDWRGWIFRQYRDSEDDKREERERERNGKKMRRIEDDGREERYGLQWLYVLAPMLVYFSKWRWELGRMLSFYRAHNNLLIHLFIFYSKFNNNNNNNDRHWKVYKFVGRVSM